jgi:hypothetical protein
MCVKPLTSEYDACVNQLAAYTRAIAGGQAPAITWLYRGGCLQMLRDLAGAIPRRRPEPPGAGRA